MEHQQETPVNRSGTLWLAIVLIALALSITIYNRWPAHQPDYNLDFYSDDDGQTWFVDSLYKVVPFDHNGKPAVKAIIFSYDNGHKKFVQMLVRYTPKGQKVLNDAIAKAQEKNQPLATLAQTLSSIAGYQEVKLPGAGHQWVPRFSAAAKQVLIIKSPDGSVLDMVMP